MKAHITGWVLLITVVTSLAQPVGLVTIEDPQFDTRFAQRTIPRVTGKLLHLSQKELKETTITYTLVTLLGQKTKTAPLASNGSFQLYLDYPLPYQ